MRLSLEEMRCLLTNQSLELRALHHKLERRTAVLSPTKSFSTEAHHQSYISACTSSIFFKCVYFLQSIVSHSIPPDSHSSSVLQPAFVLAPSHFKPASLDNMYVAEDELVIASPKT